MEIASKMCLRRQKNHDFSDWVIQGGPAAAKKVMIFRIGSSKVGLRRQKLMIFRIGSSKASLRQQKNQDFLIFRLLLNAF